MTTEQTGFLTNRQEMRLFWRRLTPDRAVRATLLVVHGYAEHSGRYGNVYDALLPLGFQVFAIDHQGHGKSEGKRGHVERLSDFVDDLHQLYREQIAPQLNAKRLFLLGHSMGSIVAMHYAAAHAGELAGLVLSGTGSTMAGTPRLLTFFAGLLSSLVPTMAIKSPFKNDFISHDPAVVEAYTSDPLVFAPHLTVRLGAEMYRGCLEGAAKLGQLELPLLIVYGSEDSSFAGQNALFDRYRGQDRTIYCYAGARHEVFNEIPDIRDKALADLTAWLEKRC
ncbi:MAG: lysophospholipase [Deltaproteobacteria bacterium]|nr:lysophospholipase [Deltaproteobacteria bacterium]